MNLLSVCSGIGGLDRAVEKFFDAEVVAWCENDTAASKIMARHWPSTPNVGDIKVADWSSLGPIDIICGGIPCQPWSTAGKLGRTDDDRHLWPYVADAVRVLRPRVVVVEEVAGFLAPGGLDTVLADLCALGFDAEWTTIRASDVGAPHRRERVFLLAWSADSDGERRAGGAQPFERPEQSELGAPRRGDTDGLGVGDGEGLILLPTPAAGSFNDSEDPEHWLARREVLKAKGINGNGAGVPLAVAVKMLPTPIRHDGKIILPTPSAHLGEGGPDAVGREGGPSLAAITEWGDYTDAIEIWGGVLGRPAPAPLDGRRLSPDFVEWMMGYDEGWTAGLARTQRLKCLGNAVVELQALAALGLLAERTAAPHW